MKARTKQEAFQHILAELDAGRLGARGEYGGCVYESKESKHCGVGCLFTKEQHKEIRRRDLSNYTIRSLSNSSDFFSENNLFHQTGMTIAELCMIQCLHDDSVVHYGKTEVFRDYLVRNSN
jgi:hypothetical protein